MSDHVLELLGAYLDGELRNGQLRKSALEIGWWLVPVGLVVAWIFLSTTLLVSNMVIRADEFGLLDSASARLVSSAPNEAYWSGALGQFGILTGDNLQWAEMLESFTRISASQIFWQIAIALLYLSWLAIWWARHTLQGSGQSLDSDGSPIV